MVGGAQRDGFALGIDLGTSNTVAVIRWPDGRIRPLLFDGQPVMPSLVFLDEGGHLHFGRDAQRMALLDPGRCEPNPKRRIDDRSVLLGDRDVAVVELLATILRAIAAKAHEAVGFLPRAVLTHPAAWGAPRREVLQTAAARAGFPPVTLVPEPVAAVRYFTDVMSQPVPPGHAAAVFDFGGGTLDIAVVRNDGGSFSVTGSGGLEDLGGLDVDAALANHLGEVLKAGGHGAIWQQLTTPTNTTERRHRRLFWEDVRGAKEMLSRTTVAPVSVPGLDQALHLTRDELERLATPLLERAVAETSAVIRRSGTAQDKFAGLFLVGGASRIPLVARLLHTQLGIAPTVLEQPELPVAEGALVEFAPVADTTGAAVPVGVRSTASTVQSSAAPVSAQPGASSPVTSIPVSPPASPSTPTSPAGTAWVAPTPVEAPPPPPKRWWQRPPLLVAVATLAVVAVLAGALYAIRGPHEGPGFATSLTEHFSVTLEGADDNSFAAKLIGLNGDRVYRAYPSGEATYRVVALDLTAKKAVWTSEDIEMPNELEYLDVEPSYVVLIGKKPTEESETRRVRVLDAGTGKVVNRQEVGKDDWVWHQAGVLMIYSAELSTLTGYDPVNGDQIWQKDKVQSPNTLWPTEWADFRLPSINSSGTPWGRDLFTDKRLVLVTEDRKARVFNARTGKDEHSGGNVATPGNTGDQMLAYSGKLFVGANGNSGYTVRMHDLDDLGTSSELYRSQDGERKVHWLTVCGRTFVCAYDDKHELTVLDFDATKVAFRKPDLPDLYYATPVGDRVMAVYEKDGKKHTVLWDSGGEQLREYEGWGTRADSAAVLLWSAPLVGINARTGAETQIGSRPGSFDDDDCVASATYLTCEAKGKMTVWRYRAAE